MYIVFRYTGSTCNFDYKRKNTILEYTISRMSVMGCMVFKIERRKTMKSNYELWMQEYEKKKDEYEIHLLEKYEDKKNIVKLFKVIRKYEYKYNYYMDVAYCLWNNDHMDAFLNYQTALSAYRSVTDKYIYKMMIKGKGQYTERSVVK